MAWVKFIADFEFDFRPHKACCQVYRASEQPQNLPERVVAAAVAAGAGERVERPGGDPSPEETPTPQPEAKRAVRRTKKEN